MARSFKCLVFVVIAISISSSVSAEDVKPTPQESKEIQKLISDLDAFRGEDRIAAANALAKFGPKASAAVPKLIERVEKDLTEKGLRSATEALRKIGDERAVPALKLAVRNGDTAAGRQAAAEVLNGILVATDEASKKDRKLIEGTWTITALEGAPNHKVGMSLVFGSDGSWTLFYEENATNVCRGTSIFDPAKKPKAIDFTMFLSFGEWGVIEQKCIGIYELGEKTWKMCFVLAGSKRPIEFVATPDSDIILVTFERKKGK